MLLRKNQIEAIETSKANDFASGIHYHATGTGKSWIAMYLLKEFNLKYPKKNVLWICERKDILNQQFNRDTLRQREFNLILHHFNVLDFVEKKHDSWFTSLNSASFWGKPFLCIINRCFLTTKDKYKHIMAPIHLVIHDECHSIENASTQLFYTWLQQRMLSKFKIKSSVIGFSATPEMISPLETVLSKYSIYDGFLDKVILPPKIVWLKNKIDPSLPHLIKLLKSQIDLLPYKKIVIWCGIINECISVAESWRSYFQEFDFCIDFNDYGSITKLKKNSGFKDFNYFFNKPNNALLFCAVKHREGSDIPNLDGCIFMDMVSQRSERVFIQCMGRVLRQDPNKLKKYGLVIDLKAKSTIEICNRVQYYLKLVDIFPWKYDITKILIDGNTYFVNTLDMIDQTWKLSKKRFKIKEKIDFTKAEIMRYFVRSIPVTPSASNYKEYTDRLDYEIALIIKKKLFNNFLRAVNILKLTKNISHITRGSCGSSLVCYMLGISHVDPVLYKISFARFLNNYRDTLPDVDFDFPHYLRDEVFLKLFQKWGSKIARISNHNYYHEKSALREALRRNGINKFISKYDINQEIKGYDKELQQKIYKTQTELEGQFKGFSLHCGGIIYFPKGVPKEHIIEKRHGSLMPQVDMNKIDVADLKHFKIDILSSRGLSHLYYCNNFKLTDFYSNLGDQKTIDLLCSADNIGITLAETPLMRKALLLVRPKNIMDIAICLAIIRPAAKDAKKEFELSKFRRSAIIFDDDVISVLSKLLDCNEELADKYRRGLTKGDNDTIKMIDNHLIHKPKYIQQKIRNILSNLRKYGFCKAHALSYAQLVWQLAYQKAHNPERFWKGALKNIDSCYRKWVHIYEAKCAGVNIQEKKANSSIYAQHKKEKITNEPKLINQLRKYGYWHMTDDSFFPGCYMFTNSQNHKVFRGLIAGTRMLNYGKHKKIVVFVGVSKHHYIEIIVSGKFYFDSRKVMVKGHGIEQATLYKTIECYAKDVEFI